MEGFLKRLLFFLLKFLFYFMKNISSVAFSNVVSYQIGPGMLSSILVAYPGNSSGSFQSWGLGAHVESCGHSETPGWSSVCSSLGWGGLDIWVNIKCVVGAVYPCSLPLEYSAPWSLHGRLLLVIQVTAYKSLPPRVLSCLTTLSELAIQLLFGTSPSFNSFHSYTTCWYCNCEFNNFPNSTVSFMSVSVSSLCITKQPSTYFWFLMILG